jgi:hypothetical protein
MTIDLSTLGSLAGSLARAGLPALGTVLGTILPPPYDIVASGAFKLVAVAMGVDPATPNAPATVQAAVDADPQAAVTKLQTIELAHKDAADAVNEELRIRTADVQDARAATARLVALGSPMQWGPAVISLIIIIGYAICCIVPLPHDAVQAGMYETVKLLAVTVASYWLGSSTGSRAKDDHLASLATTPTVNAQPGSRVSAGTISR